MSDDKLKAAANLWPNHFTDYHPLLELARDNGLRFIATNVPRRYASFVYHNGLDALKELSQEAKAYLPPLPVAYDPTLPGYEAMLDMAGGHGGETLPMAQAIKDATMAPHLYQPGTRHTFRAFQWSLPQPRPRRHRMALAQPHAQSSCPHTALPRDRTCVLSEPG